MGHRAAAGEGQEDSAEDQTLQDETSTEGALLCRCKAVFVSVDISNTVCVYTYFIYFLGGGVIAVTKQYMFRTCTLCVTNLCGC